MSEKTNHAVDFLQSNVDHATRTLEGCRMSLNALRETLQSTQDAIINRESEVRKYETIRRDCQDALDKLTA